MTRITQRFSFCYDDYVGRRNSWGSSIDQMDGKLLRTIGQAWANFAMTMMAACYNLKQLIYFQKAGIKAF